MGEGGGGRREIKTTNEGEKDSPSNQGDKAVSSTYFFYGKENMRSFMRSGRGFTEAAGDGVL